MLNVSPVLLSPCFFVCVNDSDPHHWGLGDVLMEETLYFCALKNKAGNLRFGRD